MKSKEITIRTNNNPEKVTLQYSTEPPSIRLTLRGSIHTHYGDDLFSCFLKLRAALPEIEFLCKGAKKNVHPSRASLQMSSGIMAYELELGKQALRQNLTNIFDYEDKELTNDLFAQHIFFDQWIKSL